MMFRNFMLKLTGFTAAIAALIGGLNYFIPVLQSFQFFTWLSLLFFFTLTLITGYIGIKSLEKNAYGFVSSVNGMVMLKLFLCVAFIIVFVIITKPSSPTFVISFFILYVLYTVFEIRQLIFAQKKKVQQQKTAQNANG